MKNRLEACLNGQSDNYLLPFFWVHGEGEEKLRTELRKIHDMGIGAVCVEARPHPEFAGPLWWRDMDVIMDEAQRLGMRVWVLDDARFPTGFANDTVLAAPANLRKWYIDRRVIDWVGPQVGSSFLVGTLLGEKERMLGVLACRRADDDSENLTGEILDLTCLVADGVLHWDVPEGSWRLIVLYETIDAPGAKNNQINHLSRDSVRLLVDAVYEPHYARYAAEFGKTFAGFFSDEPAFYNHRGSYYGSIGRMDMAMPWKPDFLSVLQEGCEEPILSLLPGLWYDIGPKTGFIRFHYMDVITRLYQQNFAGQLGDWCRAHGVEYMGHVIEDNNAHARLSNGPGHFFRAQAGQDFGGLDVVLLQILPGMLVHQSSLTGYCDGEFFHFALAKLAASAAQIDEGKKGRTMCEIFGAYGWVEGLRLMKWLADHMLVRGVNYFVPHAFTNRDFPDPDCPPHFNFDTVNPQYRYTHLLMRYMNRVSHMISGGEHRVAGAVLYHAEAEWAGEYMLVQKPLRALLERQIDADILPADALAGATVSGGRLHVGREHFGFVVVPYAQSLPSYALEELARIKRQGIPVLFVQHRPSMVSDRPGDVSLLEDIACCPVVALGNLAEDIKARGFADIRPSEEQPYLRVYHYAHGKQQMVMFFNEHPRETIDTVVSVKWGKGLRVGKYDAMENRFYRVQDRFEGELPLRLSHYESAIYIWDEELPKDSLPLPVVPESSRVLSGPFAISTSTADAPEHFVSRFSLDAPEDLSKPAYLPGFSGTVRYEVSFDAQADAQAVLELSECFEVAQVRVNGVDCGTRICPPFRFPVGEALQSGVNRLQIDVTNTLVKAHPDVFSAKTRQEPTGIMGEIRLYTGK